MSGLIKDDYKSYGTAAKQIYIDMCAKYGWETKYIHNFGQNRSLYSANATPEGYSVLFLAHNNWTGSKGGEWRNAIYHNKIEEYWLVPIFKQYIHSLDEIRVVFAKKKDGEYYFIGVYKTEGWEEVKNPCIGIMEMRKTYRLISERYPI